MNSIKELVIYCCKVQLCPTLCDFMDCSLPGSSIHGIFQARVLEWVAIFFSKFLILFVEQHDITLR